MPETWRFEQLERRCAKLEDENRRLQTQIDVFISERNQLIGMGKVARFGVKIIIGLGGYGLLRFIHDIVSWMNTPFAQRPH